MRVTIEPTTTTAEEVEKFGVEAVLPAVSVEVPVDEMTLYQVWECLIAPALLASGFTQAGVDELVEDLASDRGLLDEARRHQEAPL